MKIRGSIRKLSFYAAIAFLACSLFCVAALRIARNFSRRDVSANSASHSSSSPDKAKWLQAYAQLPLSFTENRGQTAQQVRYLSHGSQYDLFLTPQEAVVTLRRSQHLDFSPRHRAASLKALSKLRKAANSTATTALRMRFEGANPALQVTGAEQLPGKVNYFVGNDPKKWHTDIPTFAQVKYQQVYPGVDLVFYGREHKLEYDFVVAPGADPNVIRVSLSGARKLRLDSHGDVLVSVADGELRLRKPLVYQNIQGHRHEIAGGYALRGREVSFALAPYDRHEPLIVDPVLDYATYLGGTSDQGTAFAIATDSSGDAFIAGQTLSADFPSTSALTPGSNPAGTGFVVELNPSGSALLYETYLGSSTGGDFAFGVAVSGGDIYVTGETFGTDFPTSGATAGFKPTLGSNAVGTSFLTKLDPTISGAASLLYSTYLGGSNGTFGDFGQAVAADSGGNAYVTGVTYSTSGTADVDFPLLNEITYTTTPDTTDGTGFLTRIDTTVAGASSLVYSTYLGGDGSFAANTNLGFADGGFGVVVDAANKAYICGTTSSSNFPTSTSHLPGLPKAANTWSSAFISKIDTTLSGTSSLVYSTYLGGSGNPDTRFPPATGFGDFGAAIDLQPGTTVAYVTGSTNSGDFPIVGGFQTAGDTNLGSAFVSVLDTSTGTALKYSTYLSDTSTSGNAIRADSTGNAFVGGQTASSTFKATPGAFQTALASGANADGFVAQISPLGTSSDLVYYTYFGGNGAAGGGPDGILGLSLGTGGTPPTVYVAGITASADFPATTGAFDTALGSGSSSEGFAASLTLEPTLVVSPLTLSFTATAIGTVTAAQTVTLTNNTSAAIPFTSATITSPTPAGAATDFVVSANTCGSSIPTTGCTISVTFNPTTTSESATLTITDGDSSSPQSVALTGTAPSPFKVAPAMLTFVATAQGAATASQAVTLTNNGSTTVNFTSAVVTLTSATGLAADFALTPTCSTTTPIAGSGGTCTIGVIYTPSTTGTETATLTIVDSDTSSPQTVALTGSLQAVAPSFTLAVSPNTLTVAKGATGTATITITSVGSFNAAVALGCTGAPRKSTCTISPSSVTPAAGGTATAMLTFATTAMLAPPPTSPRFPPGSIKIVAPIALILMIMLLLASEQRLRTRLAMAGALLVFVALSGCGGSGGTPRGTDTLTITASSSGFTSQTTTIAVTVGPN